MTSVDAFPKQWELDLDLQARIGGSLELVERLSYGVFTLDV